MSQVRECAEGRRKCAARAPVLSVRVRGEYVVLRALCAPHMGLHQDQSARSAPCQERAGAK